MVNILKLLNNQSSCWWFWDAWFTYDSIVTMLSRKYNNLSCVFLMVMMRWGLGNRCLAQLPEPMLTDHQWGLVAITCGQFYKVTINVIQISQGPISCFHFNIANSQYSYINSSPPSAAYMRQWTESALVQVMACHLLGTWTNADLLLTGPLGTNFCEILIKIKEVSKKKMTLKMLPGKYRPFCLGHNVFNILDQCGCNWSMLFTRIRENGTSTESIYAQQTPYSLPEKASHGVSLVSLSDPSCVIGISMLHSRLQQNDTVEDCAETTLNCTPEPPFINMV